ncbi:MAG: hypothetical protein U5R46_15945 [Gammaproteobacteria bacterium]|nr:hypothetical protein [Gammaproteobacteria bacterium]
MARLGVRGLGGGARVFESDPLSVRLSIATSESRLSLPVRETGHDVPAVAPFAPPEGAPPVDVTLIEPEHHNWWVKRNLAEDVSILEAINETCMRNSTPTKTASGSARGTGTLRCRGITPDGGEKHIGGSRALFLFVRAPS